MIALDNVTVDPWIPGPREIFSHEDLGKTFTAWCGDSIWSIYLTRIDCPRNKMVIRHRQRSPVKFLCKPGTPSFAVARISHGANLNTSLQISLDFKLQDHYTVWSVEQFAKTYFSMPDNGRRAQISSKRKTGGPQIGKISILQRLKLSLVMPRKYPQILELQKAIPHGQEAYAIATADKSELG